jgi:hypothetical protein
MPPMVGANLGRLMLPVTDVFLSVVLDLVDDLCRAAARIDVLRQLRCSLPSHGGTRKGYRADDQ